MKKLIRDRESIIKFDYSFLAGGKKFFLIARLSWNYTGKSGFSE
jgi:hypothetical protein